MRWRRHVPRSLDLHWQLLIQTNGLQSGAQVSQLIENMAERQGFEPWVRGVSPYNGLASFDFDALPCNPNYLQSPEVIKDHLR